MKGAKIVFGVLLLIFAVVGGLAISHWKGKSDLEKWKARMRAKGEKLSLKDLAPPKRPQTNDKLPRLVAAVVGLRAAAVYPGDLSGMVITTPGRARPIWGQQELTWAKGRTCPWTEFASQYEQAGAELEQIRNALDDPPLDSGWDYENPSSFSSSQLPAVRKAVQWLWGAVVHELHQGDLDAALSNLRAMLGAVRLHEEDWTLVHQMIRVAITRLAVTATWEALQAPGWTEPQLARLQAAWEAIRLLEQFEKTFQIERAMTLFYFDDVRKHGRRQLRVNMGLSSTNLLAVSFNDFVYEPLWRIAWSHQDELFYLESMELALEAIRQGKTHHDWTTMRLKVQAAQLKLKELSLYNSFRYQLTQNAVPNWEKAIITLIKAETMKQMVITAIALKRFELKSHAMPPDLQALVPQFLSALPLDYMDGKPLRYHRHDDRSVTLYSVGQDGRDDGGDPMPDSPWLYQSDIWSGHDVLWPMVAQEAESDPAPAREVVPLIVVEDLPLQHAIENLARHANLNVQIDPKVLEHFTAAKGPNVNIRATNTTTEDALRAILSKHKLVLVKVPGTSQAGVTFR